MFGSGALEPNPEPSRLLWIQTKVLLLATAPSPNFASVLSTDLLRDRVDEPLIGLLAPAVTLALYCIPFFAISWAFCMLREVR